MGKDLTKVTHTLFLCNGGTCKKHGSEDVTSELRCAIKMAGLHNYTHTAKTLCLGQCENAPVMFVSPDNIWYKRISDKVINELINTHLKNGQMLSDKVLYKPGAHVMYPEKIIKSKVSGDFVQYSDKYVGEVNGAQIYPWEFNIYPLLKELFIVFKKNLRIWINGESIEGQKFDVRCENESALVLAEDNRLLKEVVMKTGGNKALITRKVSAIKLYHRKEDNVKGLYMTTPDEGLFLHAIWDHHGNFWNHITQHYATP